MSKISMPSEMTPSPSSTLAAAEASLRKKRARDRRAQQKLRTKKNSIFLNLQNQLAIYEDQTAAYSARISYLESLCDPLRWQHGQQSARGETDAASLNSWQAPENPPKSANPSAASSQIIFPLIDIDKSMGQSHGLDDAVSISPFPAIQFMGLVPTQATAVGSGPAPSLHYPSQNLYTAYEFNDYGVEYSWVSDPRLAIESPDLPKPLELLYGSKQNKLANAIHRRLGMRACREPERLAYGWLLYLYAKWRSEPTSARFSLLPDFLKPQPEQIQNLHPGCIDGVIWPKLRVNLVLKQGHYDLERFAGFIACCLKVRWPWGLNLLQPNDDGNFTVRQDFYDIFMSINGWGLTREFIRAYPELMEGLDLEAIHYEVA